MLKSLDRKFKTVFTILAVTVFTVLIGLANPDETKAAEKSVTGTQDTPTLLSSLTLADDGSDVLKIENANSYLYIDTNATVAKIIFANSSGCNLTITGNGTNTLTVASGSNQPIGNSDEDTLTVNSGNIVINSGNNSAVFGKIIINGGSIETNSLLSHMGQIEISGGTVNAAILIRSAYEGEKWFKMTGGELNANVTGDRAIGVSGGYIEISGGKVNVKSNYEAINATGNITISGVGTEVTAEGSPGIKAGGNISITGGKVTATNTDASGYGFVAGGTISIAGTAEVTGSTNKEPEVEEPEVEEPEPKLRNIKADPYPIEAGTITGIPEGGKAAVGTVLTLTAKANKGYTFAEWGITGAEFDVKDAKKNPITIEVDEPDDEDDEGIIIEADFDGPEEGEEKGKDEPGSDDPDDPTNPANTERWKITYDNNGGKGEMNPQVVVKGGTVNLKKNRFTRSGYTFTKWNTKADGSGSDFEDEASYKPVANVTMYAQWKKSDKHDKKDEDDDDDDDGHHSSESGNKPATVNPLALTMGNMTGLPYGSFIARSEQGPAAKTVFAAARPAGYAEGFTFNLITNGTVNTTLKKGSFTMTIPAELRKPGRTFAITGLDKNGKTFFLPDTDTDPNTITVAFDLEGYAFDLIYKD